MIKKTASLTIIILTILTSITFNSNATGSIKSIKVGDYIKFGRYNGDFILWRVININEDGSAMIFSEKILCLKPFDSAESGVVGELGGIYTTDEFRQKYGSNKWSNSNLREWLNSNQKAVKYTTQLPTDKAVYGGMNDYVSEAGFLSNFTQKEQAYILPVRNKCLLAEVDNGPNISGSKAHIFKPDIKSAIANYEDSFYENVTDKVFVPDIKELHDFVYARGWEYKRPPTDKALDISENLWDGGNIRKYYEKKSGGYWFFWLRTPSAYFSSSMRFVNENGLINEIGAISGSCGVAPALNIKASTPIAGGMGSMDKPYITNEEVNTTVKGISKPATPRGLKATKSGTNITVSWSRTTGADSYYLYSKKSGGNYSRELIKTTSKKIYGIEKRQTYYFKVSAVNSAGESAACKEIKCVIDFKNSIGQH